MKSRSNKVDDTRQKFWGALLRTFAVKDVEDQLEASKKAESVTMGEIDKEMRSVPCYNIVDSLLISIFQGD